MNYIETSLETLLQIEKLYTIHYFEYANHFFFSGETHDFWEFICVDKGSVHIRMGDKDVILKKGDIAFHQPNEFHNVSAYGETAPNLVVISFSTSSPLMDFFRKQVLHIDERERSLLAEIMVEAKRLFSTPLDDPTLKQMKKNKDVLVGTEQLIRMHLEYFLLHLLRRYTTANLQQPVPATKNSADSFKRISDYMELNITARLTIEQICQDNQIGRTQLQKIFQKETGLGVIEYFSKLKIDAAKHMIRSGHNNFTQISEQLGYTSIHYFSRQFKKITNMTPTEYASSIKAITEKNESVAK